MNDVYLPPRTPNSIRDPSNDLAQYIYLMEKGATVGKPPAGSLSSTKVINIHPSSTKP
jgi:hypothetical protein